MPAIIVATPPRTGKREAIVRAAKACDLPVSIAVGFEALQGHGVTPFLESAR